MHATREWQPEQAVGGRVVSPRVPAVWAGRQGGRCACPRQAAAGVRAQQRQRQRTLLAQQLHVGLQHFHDALPRQAPHDVPPPLRVDNRQLYPAAASSEANSVSAGGGSGGSSGGGGRAATSRERRHPHPPAAALTSYHTRWVQCCRPATAPGELPAGACTGPIALQAAAAPWVLTKQCTLAFLCYETRIPSELGSLDASRTPMSCEGTL